MRKDPEGEGSAEKQWHRELEWPAQRSLVEAWLLQPGCPCFSCETGNFPPSRWYDAAFQI